MQDRETKLKKMSLKEPKATEDKRGEEGRAPRKTICSTLKNHSANDPTTPLSAKESAHPKAAASRENQKKEEQAPPYPGSEKPWNGHRCTVQQVRSRQSQKRVGQSRLLLPLYPGDIIRTGADQIIRDVGGIILLYRKKPCQVWVRLDQLPTLLFIVPGTFPL